MGWRLVSVNLSQNGRIDYEGTYNGRRLLQDVILQNRPPFVGERAKPLRRETTASARAPRRTRRLASRCTEPSSWVDATRIQLRGHEVEKSCQKSKSSSPSLRPDWLTPTTTFKPELELGLGGPEGAEGEGRTAG